MSLYLADETSYKPIIGGVFFGVPLHSDHEALIGPFDALDHTVASTGGDDQAGRDLVDGLMVLDRPVDLRCSPQQFGQLGTWGN